MAGGAGAGDERGGEIILTLAVVDLTRVGDNVRGGRRRGRDRVGALGVFGGWEWTKLRLR